ncbi:hypothetical protein DACRYDRAFT_119049 [Dacryopinax primogenitus]|uniref:TM7S3/TM198-like domain-containing protein n=1 Tax=Dacryopinax primogenitus (strain DJM 731) TaxID=1858805 RepID=M5FNR0_DACPD|nr:uncharacterized protein DACRYDRAFT_119049 [Dacryopinax primogenitus]EJT97820.1 hypothetical protein DACRYDRAFT_119049 [Dacryopinax primogenitus]
MHTHTFTILLLLSLFYAVLAQNNTANTSYALTAVVTTIPPSPLPSNASSLLTATPTGTPTTLIFTVIPTLSAGNGTYNSTNNGTSAVDTQVLNPIGIDPAYGVLGALLILLHIPLLLLGPKLRLYTPLLLTSHILSITTLILILHFGVEPNIALHPPDQMLRGLYLLACIVAGGVGAGIAALWREYAEWGCGAVGGFALACWIEALHEGGVVQGEWRWLLFAGLVVGGFVLTTVRVIKTPCLVACAALVGASGIMLGIDCFTAVGLKEFYIANLGFADLFPQLPPGSVPLTQSVVVELSLIAVLFLCSLAIQLRVVPLLRAAKQRQAEARAVAEREEEEDKARQGLESEYMRAEREEWEARHGRSAGPSTGSSPLLDDKKDGRPSSTFSLLPSFPFNGTAGNGHANGNGNGNGTTPEDSRHSRSLSISMLQNGAEYFDPSRPGAGDRRSTSLGALPALNLGGLTEPTGSLGIPLAATTSTTPSLPSPSPSPRPSSNYRDPETEAAVQDLKEKMALLDEIRTIKASIGKLKSETGSLNLAREESRANSDASRARTNSGMTLELPGRDVRRSSSPSPALTPAPGPTSPTAGLGPEWDAYLKQRKLYVPPPFPQAPAPVVQPSAERVRQSDHVLLALEGRRRRESMLELGVADGQRAGTVPARGMSYYDPSPSVQVPPEAARRASAYELPVNIPEGGQRSPNPQSSSPPPQAKLPHRILSPPLAASPSPPPQPTHTVLPDRRAYSPPPPRAITPVIGPETNVLSPRPVRPPPRVLTSEQLEQRHRKALSGMQRPVSQMLLATQPQGGSGQGHAKGRSEGGSSTEGSGVRSSEERHRRTGSRDPEREREREREKREKGRDGRERDREKEKEKERRKSGGDLERLVEGRELRDGREQKHEPLGQRNGHGVSHSQSYAPGSGREHRRRASEVPFPSQGRYERGERERERERERTGRS